MVQNKTKQDLEQNKIYRTWNKNKPRTWTTKLMDLEENTKQKQMEQKQQTDRTWNKIQNKRRQALEQNKTKIDRTWKKKQKQNKIGVVKKIKQIGLGAKQN